MADRTTYPSEMVGKEVTTKSAQETFELGRSVGEQLHNSAVVLLSGELGAGKTVFTKGLAAGLGIDPRDVTSPSFTLVNVHEGRLRLHHIDLYRLDAAASRELGLDEILEQEKSVVVIEWAERLAELPAGALAVDFEYVSDEQRRITFRACDEARTGREGAVAEI